MQAKKVRGQRGKAVLQGSCYLRHLIFKVTPACCPYSPLGNSAGLIDWVKVWVKICVELMICMGVYVGVLGSGSGAQNTHAKPDLNINAIVPCFGDVASVGRIAFLCVLNRWQKCHDRNNIDIVQKFKPFCFVSTCEALGKNGF